MAEFDRSTPGYVWMNVRINITDITHIYTTHTKPTSIPTCKPQRHQRTNQDSCSIHDVTNMSQYQLFVFGHRIYVKEIGRETLANTDR